MAMDRAYIDYEKFQQLTQRGVIYVTKMKKNLKYNILSDTMYQNPRWFYGGQDTVCGVCQAG